MSFLFVGIYIFALLTVNLSSPKIKITYTKCILCWYNCRIRISCVNPITMQPITLSSDEVHTTDET